jgi:hypothetical protein
MALAFVTPDSPVWPWLLSLVRAAQMREGATARYAATRRLDIHVLTPFELLAWGAAAAKSRGPN